MNHLQLPLQPCIDRAVHQLLVACGLIESRKRRLCRAALIG